MALSEDILRLEGVYKNGYGIVPKFVMLDKDLSIESKAIYAYLCSLAGSGHKTFPYRDTILRQLRMAKNTYYVHYNPLLDHGYISAERPSDKSSANIYTLISNPKKLECKPSPAGEETLGYRGLKSHGYGSLPRIVMSDAGLSVKAKGLYAYFCSFCGGGDCAFPRKDDILYHLSISEPTYYKALNELKKSGYIITEQRKESGKFSVNDYYLNEFPAAAGNNSEGKPYTPDSAAELTVPLYQNTADENNTFKTLPYQKNCDMILSPLPNICDTKYCDAKNWDTKIDDLYIKTNTSNNKYNKNNQSIPHRQKTADREDMTDDGHDKNVKNEIPAASDLGYITCRQTAKKFNLRKSTEITVMARECALELLGDDGAEKLLEEFMPGFLRGIKGKYIRDIRAYLSASIRMFEEERRGNDASFLKAARNGANSSYDISVIERIIDSGIGGEI